MSDAPRYPDRIEVRPLPGPVEAACFPPGSKSITNRALVLAALARRPCVLSNALHSDDTHYMAESLRRLGFVVRPDWPNATVRVGACHGDRLIPAPIAMLFCGNSGTTIRFLTAVVALGQGLFRLDGVARMRQRPIGDLLDALAALGCPRARSDNG